MKDVVENPTIENVMKTLAKFTSDEMEDPELKEIQAMLKDAIKEDLEISSPFDMMQFGLKLMTAKKEEQDKEV